MEEKDFIGEDVRVFYRILSHKNESELRLINVGVYPIVKIVKGIDGFVEVIRAYNGKRNVYTVLRERRPHLKTSAKSEDIIEAQITVLDFDPIRARDRPSTTEGLTRAIEVGEAVSEDFVKQGFLKPHMAITGNGVALYFPLKPIEITDENRLLVSFLLEQFEKFVRDKFKGLLNKNAVRLDSMYDLPRIGRVIGTLNVKGGDPTKYRLSRFLYVNNGFSYDENLTNFILSLGEGKKRTYGLNGSSFDESKSLSKGKPDDDKTIPYIKVPFYPMQPIPYFGEILEGNWVWEYKVDGFRCEVIKDTEVLYFGRRLEKNPNWSEKLNRTINPVALSELPDKTILDCELYSTIGRRGVPSVFANNGKAKPIIFVFDIVFYKGKFVGNLSLSKRKEILREIHFKEPFIVMPFFPVVDIKSHLKESIQKGFEGIVLKELSSKYEISYEAPIATQWWRKVKPK
uniref:ATP-dependent DNA ligase family profile domain-containing protein n=1 Tax=Caldisericum exile TaxID=693075 RepID=A0A7C4U431_9BACT